MEPISKEGSSPKFSVLPETDGLVDINTGLDPVLLALEF